MQQIRFLRPLALATALAAGASAGGAHAQTEIVQPTNPDADRLAEQMRVLAANPRDIHALIEAGMTSARMGDTAAAFAFFARADSVDATNPRILAGRATALVRMERPGEALKLFQTAEARGLSMREYAADRAFAYDLLGQPALAQADYRTALQSGERDDETQRRYALSLGITGKNDEAMRQLDPLLRRSDRAAWRARAFILAMNGDVPGAERIASSMMPGSMGLSLSPFFRRLSGLGPADRAFAVHFGELSPTPARLADLRLAPTLPAYVGEQPVQVATVRPAAPVAVAATTRNDRRSRRDTARPAALTPTPNPAPVQVAAAPTLPPPPQYPRAASGPIVQPIAAPRAEQLDAPVQPAARAAPPPERSVVVPSAPAERAITPASSNFVSLPAAAAPSLAARPAPIPQPATPAPAEPLPVRPAPLPAAVAQRPEPAPPGPAAVGKEDSVLASIVAGITIPADELAAVAAPPAEEPVRVVAAPRRPEPVKPVEAKKPEPKVAAKTEPAKPDAKGKKPDPTKPDAKTAAKKPDPKAKDAAKDPAKGEPKRIWVQVAGGANASDLPKAWKAAVAKAPAAFKGKAGWSTPLRATNRVLAGPFKSSAEAQTFVNAVGKEGISAFVFTSDAGQKVTKLGN